MKGWQYAASVLLVVAAINVYTRDLVANVCLSILAGVVLGVLNAWIES